MGMSADIFDGYPAAEPLEGMFTALKWFVSPPLTIRNRNVGFCSGSHHHCEGTSRGGNRVTKNPGAKMRPELEDVYDLNSQTEDAPGGLLSADDGPIQEAKVVSKKLRKPCRDDRKSPRNRVPDARQSCELRVGNDVLPALLVNESRGGFAVLIDRLEGLECGKKVKLHTDMGWFKVRIMHTEKVAPPATPIRSATVGSGWA